MNNNTFLKPTDEFRNYKALEEIEKNPSISQRDLASKLGVAVGIANACVHTLIKKGLIKIRGENNRSITYHLTKQGLLHKSKLALEWTVNTINFYRDMRLIVKKELLSIKENEASVLFLIGTEELIELIQVIAPTVNIVVNDYLLINTHDIPEDASILNLLKQKIENQKVDCILICGFELSAKNIEKETNIKTYKLFEKAV